MDFLKAMRLAGELTAAIVELVKALRGLGTHLATHAETLDAHSEALAAHSEALDAHRRAVAMDVITRPPDSGPAGAE